MLLVAQDKILALILDHSSLHHSLASSSCHSYTSHTQPICQQVSKYNQGLATSHHLRCHDIGPSYRRLSHGLLQQLPDWSPSFHHAPFQSIFSMAASVILCKHIVAHACPLVRTLITFPSHLEESPSPYNGQYGNKLPVTFVTSVLTLPHPVLRNLPRCAIFSAPGSVSLHLFFSLPETVFRQIPTWSLDL